MDFQRFSLIKKRKSNGALKGRQVSSSHSIVPTPKIPDQNAGPHSVKQRVKAQFMSATSDSSRLAATNSKSMPSTPTFSFEDEETTVGEPLLQDYATRSIPKEFKPVGATFLDDDAEGFSIQNTFPAQASYLRSNTSSPARDRKRDTVVQVPARTSSAPIGNKPRGHSSSKPKEQDSGKTQAIDFGNNAREDTNRRRTHDPHVAPWEQQQGDREVEPYRPQPFEPAKPLRIDNHKERTQEDTNGHSMATTPESRLTSSGDSVKSNETSASSINTLPPLQTKNALNEADRLEPVLEDDPGSFDLVAPDTSEASGFSLEQRTEELMSREHLAEIFKEPTLLLQFTSFLSNYRPKSIALVVYYLDALKALRAINYANAIAESLEPMDGFDFSKHPARPTTNAWVEEKAKLAFDAIVQEDLPAFVTHTFIQVVSVSIQRRICGTLPPHLREASEGLAEVFCLSDPSRTDNPIVFASEEFHRTTQYGVNYAIGRNCRFLQGPRTNKFSIARLSAAIHAGKEISEVFLNYRRDGSPFVNLVMVAPLLDSRGTTRYFIGAQVDVSGLVKDCTDLHGLQRMLAKQAVSKEENGDEEHKDNTSEFQQLSEMLNLEELEVVRKHGGNMHREKVEEPEDGTKKSDRPRLLLKEPSPPRGGSYSPYANSVKSANGKLEGIYQNYLLVRPYPSLRILFSSPALRVPGMLQSPFLSRIGGSARVRDELTAALAEGRGVTAKVRWVTGRHGEEEGRVRWIHCTPLLGNSGTVGVWMVVLVDDEATAPIRRFRNAPPVSSDIGNNGYRETSFSRQGGHRESGFKTPTDRPGSSFSHDGSLGDGSLQSFALV